MAEPILKHIPIYNIFDDTANDSDKSWTVPTNQVWVINFAHIVLVSTATVGNRQVRIKIEDESSNLMIDVHAGANQAASLTRHYAFLQGIFRETSFVDDEIQVPIPKDMYLGPGWTLSFLDDNAVDAAADDMTVSFQVMRYAISGRGL